MSWLVPIASCPVKRQHWKEPGSVLLVPALQDFVYVDKILPEPPFLHAEQLHLSQPFLTRELSQSLYHFLWPYVGPFPLCPCISCTGRPTSGHRTPGMASPLQSRERGRVTSFDLVAIQYFVCLLAELHEVHEVQISSCTEYLWTERPFYSADRILVCHTGDMLSSLTVLPLRVCWLLYFLSEKTLLLSREGKKKKKTTRCTDH